MEAWLRAGEGQVPISTKVILSHHDYDETPDDDVLEALVEQMFEGGADIAKIATMARRVEDSARMLALPGKSSGARVCSLCGSLEYAVLYRPSYTSMTWQVLCAHQAVACLYLKWPACHSAAVLSTPAACPSKPIALAAAYFEG